MPRIRSIKPAFFTSVTIAALALPARLTFVGLWTHVDDEGRCLYDPRLLKAALWPLDDAVSAAAVDDMVLELERHGLVLTYNVDGRNYLQVINFGEHQRISKPQKSKLPPIPPGTFRARSAPVPGTVSAGREGKGEEGKGREDDGARAREANGNGAAAAGAPPDVTPAPLDREFALQAHADAYRAYRRTHRFPDGLDATLREAAAPSTGGRAYAWDVVGSALVEMRAAQADFTPATLRAFCRRIGEAERGGSVADRNQRALEAFVGVPDGE